MFKSFDSNNSIPNNYVYTSHKGTEYMYIDGTWLNCKTMNIVESIHNFKMNQSAMREISEHNKSSVLKIGKKYTINESEYVYVGRDNFTFQGSLLNENINSRVKMMVETDSQSFENFTFGNPSEKSIPNKFTLVSSGYTYNKPSKTWYDRDGAVKDKTFNAELTADAYKDIEKYNSQDRYPVNSTVQYGGKTYTYTGTSWVSDDGKVMSDKFLTKVEDWLDENPEIEKQAKSKSSKNPTDSSDSSNNMKVGQTITDKYGKVYKFDGTDFVDSVGEKLSPEKTAEILKKHKAWLDSQKNGADSGNNKNNSSNSDSSEQNPTDERSDSTSSSSIPDGYVYTSGKGKSYYKKNGQWFSADTKKPINSSSVKPLERAALAAIDKHNNSGEVKIGTEFTSKKGIKYKYVGDDRFISDNGKLLPKDLAKSVIQQLKQQSDTGSNDEEGQDSPNTGDNQGQNNPPPEPPEPANSDSGKQTPPSQGSNESNSLEALANEIKSNPEARRIIVLLSRGDSLSLLAADILLSGKQNKVKQILNSLNNEE